VVDAAVTAEAVVVADAAVMVAAVAVGAAAVVVDATAADTAATGSPSFTSSSDILRECLLRERSARNYAIAVCR
jgi:hypothetical protein